MVYIDIDKMSRLLIKFKLLYEYLKKLGVQVIITTYAKVISYSSNKKSFHDIKNIVDYYKIFLDPSLMVNAYGE